MKLEQLKREQFLKGLIPSVAVEVVQMDFWG